MLSNPSSRAGCTDARAPPVDQAGDHRVEHTDGDHRVDDEYIPLDTLDTLDDFETVPAPGYTARGSTN